MPESPSSKGSLAERSAVVASLERASRVCGGGFEGRKREACSDRCRAALSQRRQTEARAKRDRENRATLEAIGWLARVALARMDTQPETRLD